MSKSYTRKLCSSLFLVLMCLLISSFAFADVNGGTSSQRNGGGVGNNYQWGGNVSSQIFDHYDTFQGSLGNNAPVVCDIDGDGKQDIIVNDGNLIQIWSKTSYNKLVITESFTIPSYNDASSQINSIACDRLAGDLEDDYILMVHQGQNNHINGSHVSNNNLLFIEFQTENTNLAENVIYSSNYSLVAGAKNVSDIYGGEIACDGFRISLGTPETLSYCMFATDDVFSVFSLPDGFSDFNGSTEVKSFPINLNNITSVLRRFTDAETNNRQPQQNWAIAYYKDNQKIYAHVFTTAGREVWNIVGNSQIYMATLVTTGMNTAGKMQLSDIESDDNRNDDRVCTSSSSDMNGASYGTAYLNCAIATGLVGNLQSFNRGCNPNRKAYYSVFGGYDSNYNTVNNRMSYVVCEEINDYFLPEWAGWSSSTQITTQGTYYDTSQPAVNGMPFEMVLAHYEHNTNDTIIILGNELTRYHKNNATYELINTFPHSPNVDLRALDLDNDFKIEILARDTITGDVFVYIQEPDVTPTISIFLQNPSSTNDGYFGFFDNPQCSTLPITFKASECVGGATDCTYTSSSPSSQERICSTCGDTAPFTCGALSFVAPQLDCALTPGNYDVELFIESSQDFGFYQAVTAPKIPIEVINGAIGTTCNINGTEIGVGGTPEEPLVIDDSEISGVIDSLFGTGYTTTKLILGIAIIIGLTMVVGQHVNNAFVILLTAVLATLLATLMGLIPTFIIIILFSIGVLFLIIGKMGGDSS